MGNNKSYGQSMKPLLIRDYLYENTRNDGIKGHEAHIEEIQNYLSKNYDIKASRKTIISDIKLLREAAKVPVKTDRIRNGYTITRRDLGKDDLRLIIDSIQSASFITARKADYLTDVIKGLTDIHTRRELDRKAMVAERINDLSESVSIQASKIYDAIATDSTIKFSYFHYTYNQEKRYSKNGAQYEVSPFATYWNNGRLYLFAYLSEKKEFRFFRADRMERISLPTGRAREGKEEYRKLNPRSADALQGKAIVFDMYRGPEAIVRLRCINKLYDVIRDRFPSTGMVFPDGPNHFQLSVKVQLSPPFYAWVATFGKQMQILGNLDALNGMKDFLRKASANYDLTEK